MEGSAALIIGYGALEALWGAAASLSPKGRKPGTRKAIWLRFAMWLLLALEFELGADIVRSAISPTWNEIGQLSAIAVVRTFLNYFLEKDLEKYGDVTATA